MYKHNRKIYIALIIVLFVLILLVAIFYKKYKANEFKGEGTYQDMYVTNDDISITVLGYHAIADNEDIKDPIIIDKDRFRKHLKAIRDLGFYTLSMDEFNDYINNDKPIPRKSVLITFDDGYMNNYSIAYPILKEFNMKATFFIIPKLLGKLPYMTNDQVKELSSNGMDIESHTYSHERLSEKDINSQMKEMQDSKKFIKNLTGKKVQAIAYPEGKYNDDTLKAAKDSDYLLGFTVDKGFAHRKSNKFRIKRVLVDYTYDGDNMVYVLLKSLFCN